MVFETEYPKKVITWIFTGLFLLTSALTAEELKKNGQAGKTGPSRLAKLGDDGPKSTFFNINRWSMQVEHQGFFQWNGTKHGSAGHYPKELGNVFFAEGILWGVKVTDKYGVDADGQLLTDGSGGGTPRIRVNGSMYNTGLKSGKVLLDVNGRIKSTGYSENWRDQQIWRVRRDWNTADLTSDVAIAKNIVDSTVTAAQIEATKAQYKHDWDEWPASEGAPYEDVNGDGTYTAAAWDGTKWNGDIPGFPGADQTVWTVANDLPDENTDTGIPVSVSEGGWGSPPIGFEYQLTLWGYDVPSSNPLASTIFKKAKLTYVGLPGGPADAKLDTVYFSQWIDPDLGIHTNDYVGSDTTLNLAYAYNSTTFDATFQNTYNSAVPAGGYDFLQGPKIDSNGDGTLDKTLGMSSFTYFASGSSVSDPNTRVYAGTLQWFNLMEGFLPRPEYPTQLPFVDPLTGLAEKRVLSGDPVTGTGWIDGIVLPPGDRRMVMTAGPFQMKLGETQEIVVGIIGGMGSDNLTSLGVLKFNDKFVQYAYDQNFKFPLPPSKPEVSAFGGDKEIFLDWGNTYNTDNIENHASLGVTFKGYEIWQYTSLNGSTGWKIATYDTDGQAVYAEKVDPASGLVIPAILHKGEGNGIGHSLTIKDDYSKGQKLQNNKEYYYGIRAYGMSSTDKNEEKIANSLGATGKLTRIAVTPRNGVSGLDYTQTVTNTNTDTLFQVNHFAGASDGFISVRITNPAKLRGGTYTVTFEEDTVTGSATKGSILWSMADSLSGEVLLSKKRISSPSGADTLLFMGNNYGFQVRTTGTPVAFKNFLVTAHGGGVQDPPLQGAQDFNGFPVTYTGRVNQSNGTGWFFHGGGASLGSYDGMISRIIRGSEWKYLIPDDFEYRFTYEDDNYAYLAYTSSDLIRVPMELWNITLGYRLPLWSYDYDENKKWGLVPNDHPASGGDNDPFTDWIYPRLPENYATAGNATKDDETGYQTWLAASIAAGVASGGPATPDANGSYLTGSTGADYLGSFGPELMGRNVWFVWNLDDVSDGTIDVDDPAKLLPEKGTVFKIITNKSIQTNDKYSFTINGNLGFNIAKGDANADSTIDVSDVVTLVNHIIELTVLTEHNKQYAADYNSDYAINIADGVGIINKILGISGKVNDGSRLYKSVKPEVELNPIIAQSDNQYMLKLKLLNGSISGLEFEMNYPEGLGIKPESISLLNSNFNILKNYYSKKDGSTNFVLMVTDGSSLSDNEEIQLVFRKRNQSKEIDDNIQFNIANIVLSGSDGQTQDFTLNNAEALLKIIPDQFALHSIYPNPFNPIANIPYDVAEESFVSLIIYDLLGREVIRLVDKYQMPGKYHIRWNGKNSYHRALPSGIYFLRFEADNFSSVRKITLLK